MTTKTKPDLGRIVDQLGSIKAQVAALTAVEAELKAQLIAAGVREAEGENFRATVCEQERETKDEAFKKLICDLIEEHVSRQFRTAHTAVNIVPVVKVVARTRK